ncbi:MAG: acyl carrier protein [Deltaproteobacteria bacterium]|nr:MAG: acyl carrier protein [Deltaproteobacteria bacterium]RKX57876.1 MAG: acyl carrier protein [Thermodesulfobacteriota bacterium]RKX59979.1 MAG: acyl carrier protein [Thermodesulfobacteriota bacterium]
MMSDQEIRRRVAQIMAEEFELEPESLQPDATLYEDLGLDSLDAVDMVVAMEKAFGMKMADEEAVRAVRTLGDLFDLVCRLKNQQVDKE